MRSVFNKRINFIFFAIVWAAVLYGAVMCVCNWDDVTNRMAGVTPTVTENETVIHASVRVPIDDGHASSWHSTLQRTAAVVSSAVDLLAGSH